MFTRSILVLCLLCSCAYAKRTPATAPSTQAIATPASAPATSPSARELIEKFLAQKKAEDQKFKVAHIDLDEKVQERPPVFTLFEDNSLTLQSILDRIARAKADKDVKALLITLGDTEFNLAQAGEIRDALVAFRASGKRAFVYADAYETAAYVLASGASDVCMLEGGQIMIPGIGIQTMFAKGLLDKVGVKAEYVQIGQYKGADEEYTRTEPSPQLRGEMNKVLDSLWGQLTDSIAANRKLPRAQVEDMINNVLLMGKPALRGRFVDHLTDQDGLHDLIRAQLGAGDKDINILKDYAQKQREELDFSNPFGLLASLSKKPEAKVGPAIALIYAEGVIVDGNAEDSILGGGGQVGSENLRKAFRRAVEDEDVEAIVLRIDSPGGSAMASEVMWQAARRAAKEKPVIVSVGSMAASGGYYLASASDYIFADPTAIVGSIGVVGGKFVTKDLFKVVGLNTETFSRGTNATLFSSAEPFTEAQRKLFTGWMKQTYEQFTDRVMTTRTNKIKDIDQVAHGRIFLAGQAKELGMIDEIGGLTQAIRHAAKKVELDEGDYQIKLFPTPRTLADLLRGETMDVKSPVAAAARQVAPESILRALAPSEFKAITTQLQFLRLLQDRPFILVAPYAPTLK